VPARNGSVTEAPDARHITQCGALLDAAAGDGAAADPPPLVAAVDLADMPDEVDVPPLVADVVVVVEDGVGGAIAGSSTAPDDPLVSAAPAMPEAVAAVCASPGSASATSSGRTIRTIRNSWANGSVRSEPDAFYAASRASIIPLSPRRLRSAPHAACGSTNPGPKSSVTCPVQARGRLRAGACRCANRQPALEAAARGGAIAASASRSPSPTHTGPLYPSGRSLPCIHG